jgi:alpha-1,3-rhamnosyl/mannosyltransferase
VNLARVPVAVNLLWCRPGRVGGSEEYLVRQLLGLAELAAAGQRPFSLTAFVPPGFTDAHPEIPSVIRQVRGPRWARGRAARIVAEHTWLARRTKDAALVHHGGGTAPAIGKHPIVLTVHDLQFLQFPEYIHPVKLRYLRRTMKASVRRAAVVAVPSEFVRSTVIDAYGADPSRVLVVPHGIEAGAAAPTPAAELRARYGLGEGSLLVLPAITHPHKGHRFLLEVLARLPEDVQLVLLGRPGAADRDVVASIERLGLASRVMRAGRVPGPDRDGIIAMADAVVFPSEYEGFGAPVIEAMALGTPVICSDRASLPEVAGDAALVTPLDVDAWVAAVDSLPAERERLIIAGKERAAGFTARHSAEALLAAYRRALQ